jgi:RNA polymerase-binding transcription factor DksA
MKANKKHRSGKRVPKRRPKRRAKPPASTSDILGGPAPDARRVKINAKWGRLHRHLLETREYLLAQAGKLARQAAEGTPTFSMHMADAGTDSFDRDFALSMLSSDQDALYEVNAAINRMENGTYGICELTGKPIPKSRLEAIPWARFSAPAQRQLERDGVVRHRQLSAFTSLPASDAAEPIEDEGASDAAEKE